MGRETFMNQVSLLWGDPVGQVLVFAILSEGLILGAFACGLITLGMWEEFKQGFKDKILWAWKKIVR